MAGGRLSQRGKLRREQTALHLAGSGGCESSRAPAYRRSRSAATGDAGDRGDQRACGRPGPAGAFVRGNISVRSLMTAFLSRWLIVYYEPRERLLVKGFSAAAGRLHV